MKITEAPTKIYRSFNGIEGRTIRTEKGQTFEITTMKRYSGHLVTTASKVSASDNGNFTCISFVMMDKPFLSVDHGKVKCTENIVKNAHFKGLAEFDLKVAELPETVFVNDQPEKGDILFLGGYGKDKGSRENFHIIYDMIDSDYGMKYKCVEKDSLLLTNQDYVSDYKKRKGQTIGMYFEKGFNMESFGIDENKLSDMLIEAQEVKKANDQAQKIASELAAKKAEEKRIYLSQFIQADRRKTTSIIKAHCLKTWKIAKIEVSTDVFSGGDSMDVSYYAPEEIPELERFIKSFQSGHFNSMEDIYEYSNNPEIIIDGHILQDYKYVSVYHKACELPESKKQDKPELIDWDTIFEDAPVKNDVFEIVKTKHTLKGFDLWVVKLVDRVSKDTFNDLLNAAKSLGGWYSAFNKNGAIPGFQFKNEESALNFTVNLA